MDLTPYTGLSYTGPDPMIRLVMEYVERIEGLADYVGTADDVVFHREAVTLCEATGQYLYTEYTPLTLRYERGSRPVLEAVVAGVTRDEMTDREKALALLAWIRDLHKLQPPAKEKCFCGTEEEIIEGRGDNCANQARVLAVLAQIAGLPARIALHYGGPDHRGEIESGHAVNEVYLEGRWAYFDARGRYFEWPNGRIASALDLMRFPELTDDQPPHVRAMIREGYDAAGSRTFFTGRRVTRVCNYFVWESSRYIYRKIRPGHDDPEGYRAECEAVKQDILGKMREAGVLPGAPRTDRG